MGRFEICCGAVLTQNTAWTNVQKALAELRKHDWLSPARLLSAPETRLSEVIRPAGYFNQKSRYLRSLAEWFHHADQQLAAQQRTRERLDTVRPQLLAVRGVGPETADSILLYAYGFPTFVVDTYTRRVFGRLGVVDERWDYERIRSLLGRALEKATVNDTVEQYQEAHALIVEHAKRYHGRNSNPVDGFLL
jgi:endonuclease-3 related protein